MIRVEPESPVPIYHQIAEQIRRAIKSGEFAPGDKLIPLREAAERWGVHHHTVRHAYAELARENLVESLGPHGTRVAESLRSPKAKLPTSSDHVEKFLDRVLGEASDRFGLSADELARQIRRRAASLQSAEPQVYVVECSQEQADDLAEQLMAVWRVRARGLCLDSIESLPDAPIVATYFHYNEFRTRWPRRLSDIHFVSIRPHPAIGPRLKRVATNRKPVKLKLYEYDEPTALAIAADLSAIIDTDQFEIETELVERGAELSKPPRTRPVLIPPRLWPRLSAEQRSRPNVIWLRYAFDPAELDALGAKAGWKRKRARENAARNGG